MTRRPAPFADFDALSEAAGSDLGTSDWFEMSQSRIDTFADATDDLQWIHVDVERARRESPWGSTVAHGFLTLALVAPVLDQCLRVATVTAGINYGLDRVRFPSAVPSGSRVRGRVALVKVERAGGDRARVHCDVTMEVEGSERPAAIARALVVLVGR